LRLICGVWPTLVSLLVFKNFLVISLASFIVASRDLSDLVICWVPSYGEKTLHCLAWYFILSGITFCKNYIWQPFLQICCCFLIFRSESFTVSTLRCIKLYKNIFACFLYYLIKVSPYSYSKVTILWV